MDSLAKCPTCGSHDCLQVDDFKAECLVCGEVFLHTAPELQEEEAA